MMSRRLESRFTTGMGVVSAGRRGPQRVLAFRTAIGIKLTVEYEQPALERNDYQRARAGHVCDCIILALALIQTGHNRELMNSGDAIGADEVRCAPLIR